MPSRSSRRSHPTDQDAAERARSVLARATDAHVRWLHDGMPADPGARVAGVVLVRDEGLPEDRHLAVVEIADPAPVAVRERIRARVRLHGYAASDPERPGVLRLLAHGVELEVDGVTTWIAPEHLRAASTDPMTHCEGPFLQHLVTGHADLVGHLAGRVAAGSRVVPVALDRHGLTLRVEGRQGHRDVRLEFPEPASCAGDVRRGLQALAERPVEQPKGLAALFRSGPAAARICDVSERP